MCANGGARETSVVRTSTPTPVATLPRTAPADVYSRLSAALLQGNRVAARLIYFQEVLPDPSFPRQEVDRFASLVGALDEGDRHLADADDL